MKGCSVGGLDLQGTAVISNCCTVLLQAVMGEGPVVEGSAMPWVQGNSLGVVCNSLLKTTLQATFQYLRALLDPSTAVGVSAAAVKDALTGTWPNAWHTIQPDTLDLNILH